MEKFKVCKLGGTGCKYWSEPCMHCTQDKYKENPNLCLNKIIYMANFQDITLNKSWI